MDNNYEVSLSQPKKVTQLIRTSYPLPVPLQIRHSPTGMTGSLVIATATEVRCSYGVQCI